MKREGAFWSNPGQVKRDHGAPLRKVGIPPKGSLTTPLQPDACHEAAQHRIWGEHSWEAWLRVAWTLGERGNILLVSPGELYQWKATQISPRQPHEVREPHSLELPEAEPLPWEEIDWHPQGVNHQDKGPQQEEPV